MSNKNITNIDQVINQLIEIRDNGKNMSTTEIKYIYNNIINTLLATENVDYFTKVLNENNIDT